VIKIKPNSPDRLATLASLKKRGDNRARYFVFLASCRFLRTLERRKEGPLMRRYRLCAIDTPLAFFLDSRIFLGTCSFLCSLFLLPLFLSRQTQGGARRCDLILGLLICKCRLYSCFSASGVITPTSISISISINPTDSLAK